MFQKKASELEVSISDPTQKLEEIIVSFKNYKVKDQRILKEGIVLKLSSTKKTWLPKKIFFK